MYGRRFEPAHLHKKSPAVRLSFFCGDKFTPSVTHVTPPRRGDTRLSLALYASHTPTRRGRLTTACYRGDKFTPSQLTDSPLGGICRPFVSLRSGAIAASICYADLADASGTVLMHLFVADVLSGVYILPCQMGEHGADL